MLLQELMELLYFFSLQFLYEHFLMLSLLQFKHEINFLFEQFEHIFIQFLLIDEFNIMIDNIYIMDNAFDV